MLASSVDWTNVLVALIAGLPAIIGAIYAGRVHHQVKTPSGDRLGLVAERTHDLAAANHMIVKRTLGTRNGDHQHSPHTTESRERHGDFEDGE